jgi:hypothetical protein
MTGKSRNRPKPPGTAKRAKITPAASYRPTPEEYAAVGVIRERKKRRVPAPRLKVDQTDEKASIGIDHPDPQAGGLILMAAIGATSADFLNPFISQLANAGSTGKDVNEEGLNFMLSVVKAVEPKDEIEAMLAAQMAAVHMATMTFARRLNHAGNIPQQDSAERAFNKLARTFTTQMEALKRYRTGGQQKVTVEHVHVHAGGQAIVGAVEAGGQGRGEE